jgi:hypothetical protein
MSNLKLLESKKLHYKKYLYKLKVSSPVASIFRTERQRSGNLEFARSQLDRYQNLYDNGLPIVCYRISRGRSPIDLKFIKEAYEIYNILRSASGYLMRCEHKTLIIYTNDRQLLISISKKIHTYEVELWEPDKSVVKFLTSNADIIIVDKPTDFPYKITLGREPGSVSLGKWIDNNTDKVKIGPVLLNNLHKAAPWIQGQYFYVRDEHVIFLLQIMISTNISRIDKLVYKGDIDK